MLALYAKAASAPIQIQNQGIDDRYPIAIVTKGAPIGMIYVRIMYWAAALTDAAATAFVTHLAMP